MCFSANASFTAGIVLSGTGIYLISKNYLNKYLYLSATPLLFGIQQINEGIIWLAKTTNPSFESFSWISTYLFTFIGLIVWPSWVPFALYKAESLNSKKQILKIFSIFGLTLSFALLLQFIDAPPVAKINQHQIQYIFDFPLWLNQLSWVYLIPSVIPNFFTSLKTIKIIGVLTLLFFIISKLYFFDFVFSTWCFFSALISIIIAFELKRLNKT